MSKISRYQSRKKNRLLKRMWNTDSADEADRLAYALYRNHVTAYNEDADDIDWITVNGTHTPLQEGKAIGGGKLTGRDFSQAKSVKYKKKPASAKGVKGNVPYPPKLPAHPPNINKFKNYENYVKKVDEYNAAVKEYNDNYTEWLNSQMPDHAMTEDEIADWGSKYDMYISDEVYDHVDGKLMTMFTNRFDQLASDYPDVLTIETKSMNGPVHYETGLYANEKNNDEYIMAHNQYKGFLFGECASDINDFAKSTYYNQCTGFTVSTSQGMNSVVDHEFGHRVFDYMCHKMTGNNEQITEFSSDFVNATYKAKGQSTDCKKNQKELFAEGFAAYYGGETTQFATNVGNFVNKWMGILGG